MDVTVLAVSQVLALAPTNSTLQLLQTAVSDPTLLGASDYQAIVAVLSLLMARGETPTSDIVSNILAIANNVSCSSASIA